MNVLKTFLTVVLPLLAFLSAYGQTAAVSVRVEGIRPDRGYLMVAVFDNAEAFKNKAKPLSRARIEASDNTLTTEFRELAPGRIAVAVFHDSNGDGQLNVRSMKIPVEGVGMSGNYTRLRLPKFEEAAFNLKQDTLIVIRMRYPAKQ